MSGPMEVILAGHITSEVTRRTERMRGRSNQRKDMLCNVPPGRARCVSAESAKTRLKVREWSVVSSDGAASSQ